MGKYRDCDVCTRSAIVALFYLIPKLIYGILLSWNYGLFKRKCPTCGHWLSKHAKREDGSFKD